MGSDAGRAGGAAGASGAAGADAAPSAADGADAAPSAEADRLAGLARDLAAAFGVGLSVVSVDDTGGAVALEVDVLLSSGVERLAVRAPSLAAACAEVIARVASIERFRVGRTIIGPGSA